MTHKTNPLNTYAFLLLALALLGAARAASAMVLSNAVDYGYLNGHFIVSNPSIVAVGSGSYSGNVATVNPGSAVTLAADWQVVFDNNHCIGPCLLQVYAAWFDDALANGASFPPNFGVKNFIDFGHSTGDIVDQGHFVWTTFAPVALITYFIGGANSQEIGFDFFQIGSAGVDVASGLGYRASFKVDVDVVTSEVPAPPAAWLLAAGGLSVWLRKKLA